MSGFLAARVHDRRQFSAAGRRFLVLAPVLVACGEQQQQQAAPPPPTVTVAKPIKRTIVDQDEYVGRFVAVELGRDPLRASPAISTRCISRTARSSSRATCCSPSTAGRSRTRSSRSRANLAQAKANLALHRNRSAARASRWCATAPSPSNCSTSAPRRTATRRPRSTAQEAAVKQAELDLQFTELRAPITGRIGDRRISPGNLVTGGLAGNTSMLATIVSIDPIRFEFTFDEASFLRYERLAKSLTDTSRGMATDVALKLLDEKDFIHKGRDGFRRQRHRPVVRHDPRPRAVRQFRTRCSRPACSRGCGCRARRPTRRCWCPTMRSAPTRGANSCYRGSRTTPR